MNTSHEYKTAGIIGPGEGLCTDELYSFGHKLGSLLAQQNMSMVCGGLGGFMQAACEGFQQSPGHKTGKAIGILPGEEASAANPYVDIAIPTGMGIARNILIIRTADIIIAAGGGAGTLSELAFAWQLHKKVLCLTQFEGWTKKLAGNDLDSRHEGLLIPVNNLHDISENLGW